MKNFGLRKSHSFGFRKFCIKKSLGFGKFALRKNLSFGFRESGLGKSLSFGTFGLEKNVSVLVSENLVSETKKKYKKSLI